MRKMVKEDVKVGLEFIHHSDKNEIYTLVELHNINDKYFYGKISWKLSYSDKVEMYETSIHYEYYYVMDPPIVDLNGDDDDCL